MSPQIQARCRTPEEDDSRNGVLGINRTVRYTTGMDDIWPKYSLPDDEGRERPRLGGSRVPGRNQGSIPKGYLTKKTRGSWVTLESAEGGNTHRVLDLVSGDGRGLVGHRHPRVVEALKSSLRDPAHIEGTDHPSGEKLARRLIKACGFSSGAVYLTAGGSHAVEIAARLGRLYARRPGIAGIDTGFHGLGGETIFLSRAFVPFSTLEVLPDRPQIILVPFDSDRAFEVLSRYSNRIGCLIFEPIQGQGGYRIPDSNWLREMLRLARSLDIVTICDEICLGLGRTGKFLSVQHLLDESTIDDHVDFVTLGGSLGGGEYPLSAIVMNTNRLRVEIDIANRVPLRDTFTLSPLGVRAADAILDLLTEEDDQLIRQATALNEALRSGLAAEEATRDSPRFVIRGVGASTALDFTDSRQADAFCCAAFYQGLLVRRAGAPGSATVLLAPPLTMTQVEKTKAMGAITRALETI